ncbi:hypothetical protein ACJRW5_01320 [Pseudomonas sp. SH1-B]
MISHGWNRKHSALCKRFENVTFYVADADAEAALCNRWPHIRNMLSARCKASKKRTTHTLHAKGEKPLFVKSSTIDSIPSRVRVTLGLKRRSGLYDWPLEELRNHAKAQKRTDRIPRLLGYGLVHQSNRVVNEVLLKYEHLTDWVDGHEWLQTNSSFARRFAKAGLTLITHLNRRNIYHLDLWCGNMMLKDGNLEALKAIDLENCFIGAPPYASETLGYQFALLYQYELQGFIEEHEYDFLVAEQLTKMPEVEHSGFQTFYEHFKRYGAHRKERHLIPKTGQIDTLQHQPHPC